MLLEKSVAKFQDIKGQNYDCNKFSNNKAIIILRFKNIPIQLWVFCGLYVYAVVINTILLLLIRMGKVSERIVPRLAPVVVAKVINLLSIGFFFFFFFFFFIFFFFFFFFFFLNTMLLHLLDGNSFKLNFIDGLYVFFSLGRLERLILFLPMTLFLILKIISIIIYIYFCSFLVEL